MPDIGKNLSLDSPWCKQLIKKHPNIEPALFLEAEVAAYLGSPLEGIEVVLDPAHNDGIREIHERYSNGSTYYRESVIITLEDAKKLTDLGEQKFVESIRKADNISGVYLGEDGYKLFVDKPPK
ncbi:hypothetical protein CMO89_02820 [Candidatus Woesearchaeota archaeon]|jgi:hypothetical protein|nr:hypothetical protein [Candidatus Woesearchaeota archaeon]|tara:strand:+ start:2649 stop:3020 length:372 start_codon:yes stop_codon:yes gene_type:complete